MKPFTDEQVWATCEDLQEKGLIEYDEVTHRACLTEKGWEYLRQKERRRSAGRDGLN